MGWLLAVGQESQGASIVILCFIVVTNIHIELIIILT